MEETGTNGCVNRSGPVSELVVRKALPLAVCDSLHRSLC
jgi:hypothetical protein